MKGKLLQLLQNNNVIVPILSGLGVFLIALSYEPSRGSRMGPIGPSVEPFFAGVGVGLIVVAIVRYKSGRARR